ncbi:THO complex subunit 4D [Cardamine amara subsp. amara]|uniref:THO complex subunit 4D n=1 Tax=Cardamine amara subsp. amara TaxID=228776 RepID=A0ABD1BL28_CARAN
MSGALNMTLEESIKRGKTARSGGRRISRAGRGRGGRGHNGFLGGRGHNGFLGGGGRGFGPARRGPLAVNARGPSSFSINKPVRRVRTLPWQSDLFEDGLRAAGVSGVEAGTRLHITNLDQGVTNEDIRELFCEIGELERYAVHYDKNGRPSGTAEVVYPRRSDAFQALKKYNNVLLDGRPMRLEILGGNISEAPLAGRVNVNVTGLNGRLKRTVVIQQGGGRGRGRGGRGGRGPPPTINRRLPIHNNQQGGMRGGRGGFRGRGRGGSSGRGRGGRGNGKKPVEKSVAELDKDLESYHADAMNIS